MKITVRMYMNHWEYAKYRLIYVSLSAFHKLSFIIFLIMSFIHMLVAYYIARNCCNISRESWEANSLRWKRRSMVLNVLSIMFACYFFYRHNKYCEPLGEFNHLQKHKHQLISIGSKYLFAVYSMFALSEYGVVLSNMGFHSTAAWDFANTRLMISGTGFRIIWPNVRPTFLFFRFHQIYSIR